MKKLIIACAVLLFTFSITSSAQVASQKGKAKLGLTFVPFGASNTIMFERVVGYGSYNHKSTCALGLNYIYGINNWLEAETGLEYTKHQMEKNAPPPGGITYDRVTVSTITLPISVRANFLKHFLLMVV